MPGVSIPWPLSINIFIFFGFYVGYTFDFKVQVFYQLGHLVNGFGAQVLFQLLDGEGVSGFLYRLYRGFGRQGHCIGVVVPADEPVGNVYVVFEVLGGCVLLEVVADVHFQLGPDLELPLPVVESVHVGIAAKAKTDAMGAMERAPGE